jgi:hypothetical protein
VVDHGDLPAHVGQVGRLHPSAGWDPTGFNAILGIMVDC